MGAAGKVDITQENCLNVTRFGRANNTGEMKDTPRGSRGSVERPTTLDRHPGLTQLHGQEENTMACHSHQIKSAMCGGGTTAPPTICPKAQLCSFRSLDTACCGLRCHRRRRNRRLHATRRSGRHLPFWQPPSEWPAVLRLVLRFGGKKRGVGEVLE